jgi:hypothetical protein
MIHIIDNLISTSFQEEIKNTLLGHSFPWYFAEDITFGKSLIEAENLGQPHPAHAHLFCRNKNPTSNYFDLIMPLAHIGSSEVNFKFNEVVQCRSFLQYPLNNTFLKKQVDRLHIDLPYDHLVVLYYVVDSDGDTLIVDKTREGNIEEYHHNIEDYNIIQRVKPKRGRAVIFDGKYYHTAEQPTQHMRCIINFNII